MKWALIAFVLVGTLIYGLYSLSVAPSPVRPQIQTETKAESKTETVKNKPKKENTLPPKIVEKWAYIEALENKEVHVKAKEQKLSIRPYLIQCGAYKIAHQADERRAMIAFQGLESTIKESQGKIGIWHRVVLGPYPYKRDAERDRNLLRRNGIEPCEIWFWE